MGVQILLTTCSTQEEAESLGQRLVEERLAACATAVPGATSLYRWQGKLMRDAECLLLLKTAADRVPEVQSRLHELHTYECPEFIVLAVDSASAPYEAWVSEAVRVQPRGAKDG